MANTYTVELQLVKPTPADPLSQNSWGTLLNTTFDLIDSAVAGQLSLSVAGGANVTLSSSQGAADQERNQHFVLSGALTSNILVLMPSTRTKQFSVQNMTSGAFKLGVGVSNGSNAALGTTSTVPQGASTSLVSDGTNVGFRDPTGFLGGDLSGSLPAPTVVGIQGFAVANTAPSSNQILAWSSNTSSYEPTSAVIGNVSGSGTSVSGNLAAIVGTSVSTIVDSGLSPSIVARLNATEAFTKGQSGAVLALTYQSSITPDFAASNNFSLTMQGSAMLSNPVNVVAGQSGLIAISQDATGSRLLSYGTSYIFQSGVPPVLTASAFALDGLAYYAASPTQVIVTALLNVR